MFLHWRANLADQNKQQPLKINIRVTYHTVLSVWNKPLIDTCQHCSTSRANQALCSLANAGFQNRGVCLQAFPSFPFPSPSPLFHFLALVSFLAQSKPKIPFLALSLLRNLTETLATQANCPPLLIIGGGGGGDMILLAYLHLPNVRNTFTSLVNDYPWKYQENELKLNWQT